MIFRNNENDSSNFSDKVGRRNVDLEIGNGLVSSLMVERNVEYFIRRTRNILATEPGKINNETIYSATKTLNTVIARLIGALIFLQLITRSIEKCNGIQGIFFSNGIVAGVNFKRKKRDKAGMATGLIGFRIARSFLVFQRDSKLCTIHDSSLYCYNRSSSIDSQRIEEFDRLVRLHDDAIEKKNPCSFRLEYNNRTKLYAR